MATPGFDIGAVDPSLAGYFGTPGMLPQVAQLAAMDPRRALVQSMMQTGQQSLERPTLTPGATLAKALTIALGGGMSAYLNNQYTDMNAGAMKAMQDALNTTDPVARQKILGSNPATMGMAQQQQQQMLETINKQDTEAFNAGYRYIRDPSNPLNIIAKANLDGAEAAQRRQAAAQSGGTESGKIESQLSPSGRQLAESDAAIQARKDITVARDKEAANLITVKINGVEYPTTSAALRTWDGKGTPPPPPATGATPAAGTGAVPTQGEPAAGAATGSIQTMPPPPRAKPTPPAAPPAAVAGAAGDGSTPPATPVAGATPAASGPQNASGVPLRVMGQGTPEGGTILKGQEAYQKVMDTALAARDERQKALLLKQQLHELGMGGPAIPFFGNLSRWAGNMGVSPEFLAAHGLPNGATEADAQKLSTDLLGEVLRVQFPQRITNNDIKLFQNTVPGPGLPPASNDYLFDNVILPKIQRDLERGSAVVDMPRTDPTYASVNERLFKWDNDHPLDSYTPALKPKPANDLQALQEKYKNTPLDALQAEQARRRQTK